MRQWLRKWGGLFILIGGIAGLAVWVYGFPQGYESCGGPERQIYADALAGEGYRVVCRKEGDVSGYLKFRLQLWQQFTGWARTHEIGVVYEQPRYFWFLIPAGTNGAEGFVYYEYR